MTRTAASSTPAVCGSSDSTARRRTARRCDVQLGAQRALGDAAFEERHTFGEIIEKTGKDRVECFLDIVIADELKTVIMADPLKAPLEYWRELIEQPYVLPGQSDGGAHTKLITFGRYPTEFLTKFVRDRAWVSLEDAHWRLSAYAAYCAGIRNRGVLQEGAAADIVVYDYENLEVLPHEVLHDYPGGEWRRVQRAMGYRFVLVNGEVTIEDDKETGVASGRLLRGGRG